MRSRYWLKAPCGWLMLMPLSFRMIRSCRLSVPALLRPSKARPLTMEASPTTATTFRFAHQIAAAGHSDGGADRRAGMPDRKKGSVSGFPNPEESPYDLFAVGHAGTAISTAVGMARGADLMRKPGNVVAVVGDASIVNGLAFEGLNNAGTLKRQLLIILNDNGMSISQPQGAFSQYLERIRVSTTYGEAKRLAEKFVGRLPQNVGHTVESVWRHVTDGVKMALWPGKIFETLGIKYFGLLDGHDLPGLIDMLAEIKHVQCRCFCI